MNIDQLRAKNKQDFTSSCHNAHTQKTTYPLTRQLLFVVFEAHRLQANDKMMTQITSS